MKNLPPLLVLAPEFDKKNFPDVNAYLTGNVLNDEGELNDEVTGCVEL